MNFLEEFKVNERIFSSVIKDAGRRLFIVDPSVVVKWFSTKEEDDIQTATKIYTKVLSKDYYMLSPELLVYELLNIFRYKSYFESEELEKIVKGIFGLLLIIKLDYRIYLNAYEISKEIDDSVYDCTYIAMSKKYNAPLLTADKKLYERAKNYGYDVILLSEFAKLY